MWELDETETNEVLGKGCITEEGWKRIEALKKAILRHVVEEGEKRCPLLTKRYDDRARLRRECAHCWAELKQEAGC